MSNENIASDKFMNYIENLVKERLRKKLDRNIDFALFDEIKKEYKELDNKIKKNNQWVVNNAPSSISDEFMNNREDFFKKLVEKLISLKSQKNKLDNRIIKMVSNLKLFEKSLFRKIFEWIKSIFKRCFSKKTNNNLNKKQLHTENECKILKPELNIEQIN
ncbi:hypothetical protein [Spiroplasma sp. AdecLV25b]|uniref:hypothetical protein n=1 Tax=Spiroplasma sp. AdecLV25b TaxID=3027162 RepID=UPI0027E04BEA|nr:hypothetical protein [Spiroplasma sp. AdecLV25b]